MRPAVSRTLVLLIALLLPTAAVASPGLALLPSVAAGEAIDNHGAAPAHDGGQLQHTATPEEEHHNILAFKGIGGVTIHEGDTTGLYGPGLIWEHTLIEHWLELEVGAAALFSEEHTAVPVDVIFKKPFHLGRVVTLFVGIGPSMTIITSHEEHVAWGGIVTVGGYVWFAEHWGLLAEADYAIGADHGAVNDLEFATGLAWRFW